jgi:hypothetical protein
MAKPNSKSVLFKPASGGGWIFRAPSPWLFGDVPHYVVNDAQKAQIEAILEPRLKPALLATVLILAIFAWVFAVAGLVWALGSGQDNLTASEMIAMVVLILAPIAAGLPLAGWIQRRRLQPVLKNLPLTTEHISLAELNQSMKNVSTVKQSLLALIASVVACVGGLSAAGTRLATKHGFLDGQTIVWTLVAIVFGFQAVRWYRIILTKAAERQ